MVTVEVQPDNGEILSLLQFLRWDTV